jgi:hypothetical protein
LHLNDRQRHLTTAVLTVHCLIIQRSFRFLFSFKIPLAALPLVPLPSLLGAVAVGLSNNALSSFAT